jgi:hypothetical protein
MIPLALDAGGMVVPTATVIWSRHEEISRRLVAANAAGSRMQPTRHHDLNLLEQGHRERDERHEQRGAGKGVRHERRCVGRARDEVRLRHDE